MPQGNIKEEEQTRSSTTDPNFAAIGESDHQLGEILANTGHSRSASGSRVEWDAKMEIEFFRAVMKNRPVGKFKIIFIYF